MADKQVMEAYKEQVKAEKLWDNKTFAQLMDYSAVEAAQYCIDCGIDTIIHGMSAQEYVDTHGVNKATKVDDKIEVVKEVIVEETTKDDGLTKEDIQELLKANNIKFHPATGIEKLVNLAKENGLL